MIRRRPAVYLARAGLSVAVALAVSVGCTVGAPPPTTTPVAPAHWTYAGEEGPANWGELSPEYEACSDGREQSPIDIEDPVEADLANVAFDYRPAPLRIVNNGHTVQVNYQPGSSMTVDDSSYELLQFHLHAPSEHHIAGRPADAELHLVHRGADDQLAVVGVLLMEGAASPGLAPVFDNLPGEAGPEQEPGIEVDASALLPARQTTYRYSGSLTTPPCTEGVAWLLMTEPLEISPEQLAAFTALLEGNNRPVQPLNDRDVTKDLTP